MKHEILEITRNLVAFKTVHPNYEETQKCFDFIKDFFSITSLHIKEFTFNCAKSLIVSNHQDKDSDIVFCGHIDVVPAPDHLFNMRIDNDILLGRGVSDMKGQVAVMMHIMKILAYNPNKTKVSLFLTSDEERGGFDGVNKLLNEQGYTSKVAIVPDGGFDFKLVTEAKGVLPLKITAQGVSCHAAEVWNGINALEKLIAVFNYLRTKFTQPRHHTDWKTSINLAKIEGGDAINKVPDKAFMFLDIRHIYHDAAQDIIDCIKGFDPSLDVEVLAAGDPFLVDEKSVYVRKYIKLCESFVGKSIETMQCHTASDGRFFSQNGIDCIVMNPVGGNIHCINEWVNLESLCTLGKIYEQYVCDFK